MFSNWDTSDTELFNKNIEQELIGMSELYVQDSFCVRNVKSSDLYKNRRKSLCGRREWDKIRFAGFELQKKITCSQFIKKCTILNLKIFLMTVHILQFHYFPQNSFESPIHVEILQALLLYAPKVTEKLFEQHKKLTRKIKMLSHSVGKFGPYLKIPKFKSENCKIWYVTLKWKQMFTVRYISFLTDQVNTCEQIYWTSYKSKRITRSALWRKHISFANTFHLELAIEFDLQISFNQDMSKSMVTDSLYPFGVLTSMSMITKCLKIDLHLVKEPYHKMEIPKSWLILF